MLKVEWFNFFLIYVDQPGILNGNGGGVEAGVKEPENPPAPDGLDGFPDSRKVEFVTYVNGKLSTLYHYNMSLYYIFIKFL